MIELHNLPFVAILLSTQSTNVTGDIDLTTTFGPDWQEVTAFIGQVMTLPSATITKLSLAGMDAQAPPVFDKHARARSALGEASRGAGIHPHVMSAGDTAKHALQAHCYSAAQLSTSKWAAYVVGTTAMALAARHLIGHRGYTGQHYFDLTREWSKIVGKPHPDDMEWIECDG